MSEIADLAGLDAPPVGDRWRVRVELPRWQPRREARRLSDLIADVPGIATRLDSGTLAVYAASRSAAAWAREALANRRGSYTGIGEVEYVHESPTLPEHNDAAPTEGSSEDSDEATRTRVDVLFRAGFACGLVGFAIGIVGGILGSSTVEEIGGTLFLVPFLVTGLHVFIQGLRDLVRRGHRSGGLFMILVGGVFVGVAVLGIGSLWFGWGGSGGGDGGGGD
jgi:hypothetical protein